MSRAAPTQPPRKKPKRTHLELASGRYLDYTDPRPEDMSLEDITLALSNCCRWGGHCPEFYSVAEHACLVHDIVRAWHGDTATCLAALHHDDHEAFVGDVPTPLKNLLGAAYYGIVDDLDWAIGRVLEIDLRCIGVGDINLVKRADALALHLEAERFKPSQGRTWTGRPAVVELPAGVEWACGLSPAGARGAFLGRHRALTSGR